jgi:hypothetical protein
MNIRTKIAAVAALTFTATSAIADPPHFHGYREWHGGGHSGWGWVGGAIVGGLIVHEMDRDRYYNPPYRHVLECRYVTIIEPDGYQHLEKRCREVVLDNADVVPQEIP